MTHNLDDINCILDISNNKIDNNSKYIIDIEVAQKEDSSDSETNNNSCFSKTTYINKEEHDKQCAKYSIASFLLGVCGIVIFGILNLKTY
tara:strand:- start:377 stop:646 length:270 start_codon:yes stop_codon:yes gene_type:complete